MISNHYGQYKEYRRAGMIKLIACDMDGTLLDRRGNLNKETFDIIKRLKQQGIYFAAASGRQYYNLEHRFDKVKDDILYIAENGSYVVDKGKELFSNSLDKQVVKEFIEFGRRLDGSEIILCGKKAAYIEKSYEKFVKEVEKYYYRYEIVNNLCEIDDDILKLTVCDFKGAAENSNNVFEPLWADKLQVTVSGEIWLDITNKNVNKGVAIKLLQDKLNIAYEETMVFGDYFNDLEMLKSAHHSYAMENAPEEVKKHARFVAKSNEENGVLEVIKSKVLLNIA